MANKMTWDGAADQHLLLSILTTHDVKVDFDIVATHLGCTPRAVQERLKKLRKMAAEHTSSGPAAAAAGVGPKTPTKAKPKSPAKTKGAPEGGDAVTPSPKKRKVATPKGGKGGGVKEGMGEKATGVVEAVYEGDVGNEEEMGEYAMGPEMDRVVKEEDFLGDSHDPVLYDAQIGLLSSEI